ncbi:TetR/AcrR family transcriptional regulator [Vagococcus sp.]|uniref:TetR/AcrR family transcriptional regulator n=1 Tax=Vagococcus sp. TaxID=1933889 RepID=UPI002FC6C36C
MQLKKKDIQMKIQETALQLFYEKGYDKTKISDIGKQMGMSVGNVYTYFENKDDLFYTVVSQNTVVYFEENLMALLEAYNDYLIDAVSDDAAFELIEKHLKILVNNYREIVIMLDKNEQTAYEGIKEKMIREMAEDRLKKVFDIEAIEEPVIQDMLRFYKIICRTFIDLILNGLKEEMTTTEERYDLCLGLIRYQAKEK